jgi:GTP-binding protein HflX
MLVDTVGFVSKLPHNLVASFYNTLAEIRNADLIIHVLDSSSEYINEQLTVVMEVLNQLGALKIPQIMLFNKWDETRSEFLQVPGFKTVKYSNKTGLGLEILLQMILDEIKPSSIHARLLIPYSKGDLSNLIEEKAEISNKDYREDGIYYEVEIPKKLYSKVKDYDLDMLVS